MNSKTTRFLFLVIFTLVYLLSLSLLNYSNTGKLQIYFIDVGQGDSIYIKTPGGKKILIDGGPSYKADEFLGTIMPLNCKIDVVFVTHSHSDHINGLNRILERCQVSRFFYNNNSTCESKTCSGLNSNLEEQNVSTSTLYANQTLTIDSINFIILWPLDSTAKHQEQTIDLQNPNNDSIVLLLDYGEYEALFTGDAEKEIYDIISHKTLKSYIENGLDLLKVPHQGSSDSLNQEFFTEFSPSVAVISVGENSYAHPHQNVVDFYLRLGSKVLRTDQEGTIHLVVEQ